MGEVKSTLDLVMERTRHLSLSAEEKARQQEDDFRKRLQGLLQKYEDGAVSAGTLLDRVAELQRELHVTDRRLLLSGVLNRIDPGRDNKRWLDLLAELAPGLRDSMLEILEVHRRQEADLLQACEQRLLDHLAMHHGIEGPEVAANPQRDSRYMESLDALLRKTRSRLEAAALQAR